MHEAAREIDAFEVLAKLVFNVPGQRAIVPIACIPQILAKVLARQPRETVLHFCVGALAACVCWVDSMMQVGTLHLLIGPVGAGKTTYGRQLATRNKGLFLDLDPWMVRLFGADARPPEDVIAWYLERRERCRGLLWDVTVDVLHNGIDVVLEFGLVTAADRQTLYEKAGAEDLRLVVYHLDAPREIRRQRVVRRNECPGPFTQVVPLKLFDRASDIWESPSESERRAWGIIDA
jgi:predicted kinase